MADETTVGEEFADNTSTQVGIIGNNIADTAGEAVDLIKEGILNKLDGSGSFVEPPPPPDVSMPEPPPAARDALKEAAGITAPPSADNETTLHDQLEQARSQMAQLGK